MELRANLRLNKNMSSTRFEGIFGYLRYRVQKYVGYYDGFFRVLKMEESWNLNMAEQFNPSWINLLEEIMMEWFNKYTPGFMCVECKPHPFNIFGG